MDSVQFKNIGTNGVNGLNQVNAIQQNNRKASAVTNPSAKNISDYRPNAYKTAVTVRTSLATKEEKKKI